MKPLSENLWLSLCLSVGVHVTAAAVLQHWGVGAKRAVVTRHTEAALEVIVVEPARVPVAKVTTAPVSSPAKVAPSANPPAVPTPAPVASASRVTEVQPKLQPAPPLPTPPSAPAAVLSPTPRVAATQPRVDPSLPAPPPRVAMVAPAAVVVPTLTATPAAVAGPSAPVVAPAPNRALEEKNGKGDERAGVGRFTISLPEYRSNPAPTYPDSARRKRQEGVVWLMVEVGEHGETRAVAVQQSSGHTALDEAAVVAVRGWKFAPARQGERPVAARVEVPVRFRLGT